MLSTIISKYNVVVIINVIFIVFFNCDYELRRLKTNYKRSFSIFITLRHRFLKRESNVINVLYNINKINFLIKLILFDIIRLRLT